MRKVSLAMLVACGGHPVVAAAEQAQPLPTVPRPPAPLPAQPLLSSSAQTWVKAGGTPERYTWSADEAVVDHGAPTMVLAEVGPTSPVAMGRNIVANAGGPIWGTAHAVADAKAFLGKRVRIRASIRTEGVVGGAWLWMRFDDAITSTLCNTVEDPITDTHDFTPRTCVLQVPATAATLVFGIGLNGNGRAWVAGASFEEVSSDVAVTGGTGPRQFDTSAPSDALAILSHDVADRCFHRAGPSADLQIRLELTVSSGRITRATASGADPTVNQCIEMLATNWLLPYGANGIYVVPFHFVRR